MLVIDACGAGEMPDAERYGDRGVNTLVHLAQAVGGLRLPVLGELGLGSILPIAGVPPAERPMLHGRLHPLGHGKDSITGHWEMMGVVADQPLPAYPRGLPQQLSRRLTEAMGRQTICNLPRNGISAIEEFGDRHLRSGDLILYTSQDSVIQLAAHVERVPPDELYAACEAAREAMSGPHAVGRVIARPFQGASGAFARTEGRRDFTLAPPSRSHLQELSERGVPVHAVGKISDLFAGVGVSRSHPGATNARALQSAGDLLRGLDAGLIFVNLIETDQVYGHRKDVRGFHFALQEIDAWLGEALTSLREDDLLIITADHGVDPAHPGTDHTREHVPLLALTGAMWQGSAGDVGGERDESAGAHPADGRRHDGPLADVGASVLRWLTGEDAPQLPGRPFVGERSDA